MKRNLNNWFFLLSSSDFPIFSFLDVIQPFLPSVSSLSLFLSFLFASLTLLSFLVPLTPMSTTCCYIHIWATLFGCHPCSQLEMPDELESVLWGLRSPPQLSSKKTSSECTPSQSSPLTFIRDSVNVRPASDCSLIRPVILSLYLFKHSYSRLQDFVPDALSHLYAQTSFLCSFHLVWLFVPLINELPRWKTYLHLPSLAILYSSVLFSSFSLHLINGLLKCKLFDESLSYSYVNL